MMRNKINIISAALTSVAIYLISKRSRIYARNLSTISIPPKLMKKPHFVPFGNVSDQNRGTKPMEPIVYLKDPYFYVRDDTRSNIEIISHLEKENAYTNYKTKHLETIRKDIYNELLSHIQETDTSVPYPDGKYEYYTKTVKGLSYTIYCRRLLNHNEKKEEIILDVNELAKGHKHCQVASVKPSPDHTLLCYTMDNDGYETYTLYIKDLKTSTILTNETVHNMSGSVYWGKDNTEIFYSTLDKAHRVNKVWRHTLGIHTNEKKDECLLTENDEIYSVHFRKTRSGQFIIMGSSSSETSEYYYLDLYNKNSTLKLIEKKRTGIEYTVEHHKDKFYIITNQDNATNFKLVETSINEPNASNWKDVFPYDSFIKTDDIDCFENYMVLYGRQNGFSQIWTIDLNNKMDDKLVKSPIEFDEPIYTLTYSPHNKEYNTDKVRFFYSSMTTPLTTYDYHMSTKKKYKLKEKPCPNYDRSLYKCERLEAIANDGTTKIPMSMVYRKDLRLNNKKQAVHLYGYGSYEISIDPDFRPTILPLLDRGVIYIIAHVRGGGEMGRTWYEEAKYLNKKKTFTDFINCAEYIINKGITSPELLTIEGRSAGGLLMGSVLNMRPDLFRAAIAGVPFVDVMSTMSDSSIPLTTGEWEEWGNPNEMKYFSYMLSYSPYDNVKKQNYPNILVTSGLHDPRVAYWEPTKWVQKIREYNTNNNNDILLKMDLSSGHFSASDRYHYLKEKAFDIAFLLDQVGKGMEMENNFYKIDPNV